jgi:hypothetical protein
MLVRNLAGAQLRYWFGKADKRDVFIRNGFCFKQDQNSIELYMPDFKYDILISILIRNEISVVCSSTEPQCQNATWVASNKLYSITSNEIYEDQFGNQRQDGYAEVIMKVFIMSKFGAEVSEQDHS